MTTRGKHNNQLVVTVTIRYEPGLTRSNRRPSVAIPSLQRETLQGLGGRSYSAVYPGHGVRCQGYIAPSLRQSTDTNTESWFILLWEFQIPLYINQKYQFPFMTVCMIFFKVHI